MKKYLFTVFVFLLTKNSFSQNTVNKDSIFSDLITYTPKGFHLNSVHIHGQTFKTNNLSYLNSLAYFNHKNISNKKQSEQLFNQIDQMAVGFFSDGKKVLFEPLNGMASNGTLSETIFLNDIKIIKLKLLHTCTDADRNNDFIRVFNNRMYALLKIKPPDNFTHHFNNTTFLKNSNKTTIKLFLNENRTFQFGEYQNKKLIKYSEGFWENNQNKLTLNSNRSIDNGNNYISFKNSIWTLKKKHLIPLDKKHYKLKEVTHKY